MRSPGSAPNSAVTMCASSPPGGSYCSDTRTSVPPPGCGSKWTEPACSTRAPGAVRQAISSLGLSLMISASHSIVVPAGPFTTQCERPPGPSVTDSILGMIVGRFRNSRQKAYSFSRGSSNSMARSTLTPRLPCVPSPVRLIPSVS